MKEEREDYGNPCLTRRDLLRSPTISSHVCLPRYSSELTGIVNSILLLLNGRSGQKEIMYNTQAKSSNGEGVAQTLIYAYPTHPNTHLPLSLATQ